MKYYYNEKTKSFAISVNFDFKETPKDYNEITKEEFEALQEEEIEKQKEGENNDN